MYVQFLRHAVFRSEQLGKRLRLREWDKQPYGDEITGWGEADVSKGDRQMTGRWVTLRMKRKGKQRDKRTLRIVVLSCCRYRCLPFIFLKGQINSKMNFRRKQGRKEGSTQPCDDADTLWSTKGFNPPPRPRPFFNINIMGKCKNIYPLPLTQKTAWKILLNFTNYAGNFMYSNEGGNYTYRPVVTICTTSLTFNNSPFCPHSVFMCFVWIWEQTAIISLYSINWLVCITATECVYCAVRTGSLYIIQVMCFVWIWEQTAIISLYNINWLVCVTKTECLLRGSDWVFIYNSGCVFCVDLRTNSDYFPIQH